MSRTMKSTTSALSDRPGRDVPLTELREHPDQCKIFAALPASEFKALKASMAQHGQMNPIEVSEDGTILDGHQRFEAAKALRWQTIQAIVRSDLGDPMSPAARRRLVEANLVRRHLGLMGKARAYRALRALLTSSEGQRHSGDMRSDLRDEIGRLLNISGRSLDRYEALLSLPIAIQDAVDARRLTITTATKILKLSREKWELIAADLVAGQEEPDVVSKYLSGQASRRSRPLFDDVLGRLHQVLLEHAKSFAAEASEDEDVRRFGRTVAQQLLAIAGEKPLTRRSTKSHD